MNNSKILCRSVYDFSNQTKVSLNLFFIILLIVFFDFSRCVKVNYVGNVIPFLPLNHSTVTISSINPIIDPDVNPDKDFNEIINTFNQYNIAHPGFITAVSLKQRIQEEKLKKSSIYTSAVTDLISDKIPPRYDVLVYKITYIVAYPKIGKLNATKYMQSALLLVPTLNKANVDNRNIGWGLANKSKSEYNNIGNGPFPLLYRSHSMILNNNEAPTVCDYNSNTTFCEAQLGILEASQGFIVIMPDYLGFGASAKTATHPFLYPDYYQIEAETLINLVANSTTQNASIANTYTTTKNAGIANTDITTHNAGITNTYGTTQNAGITNTHGTTQNAGIANTDSTTQNTGIDSLNLNIKKRVKDNKQFLFLTGNNEGGFATLAIQKYLEASNKEYPFFLTASAPVAPPADLNLTVNRILARDYYINPTLFVNLYFTYKNIYKWDFKNEDLFYEGNNYNNEKVNYGNVASQYIISKNKSNVELNQLISDPNNHYSRPANEITSEAVRPNPILGELVPMTTILKPSLTNLWIAIDGPRNQGSGYVQYAIRRSVTPNLNDPYIEIYKRFKENSLHTDWKAKTDTRVYQCQTDLEIPGFSLINDGGNSMNKIVKRYEAENKISIPFGTPIPSGLPFPDIGNYFKSYGFYWWNSKLAQSFFISYFTKFINSYDVIPTSNTIELYANLNLNNNPLDGLKVLPVSYLKIVNNPYGNIIPLPNTYTNKGAQIIFDLYAQIYYLTSRVGYTIDFGLGNSTLDMQNDDYAHNNRCPLIGAALPWFVTYLNN